MVMLVTGGAGFVGSAVVRRLLAAAREVRVLVRPGTSPRNLEGLDIELAVGDLRDPASFPSALAGCEALFHVAADYRLYVPQPAELYATNVEGTRALLRAAGEAGVRRVVYTSSVATLGVTADGSSADETSPVRLADMIGHYERSKFLAEEVARVLAREEGVPVVIVNPSTPVGPRDIRPTPTGRMVVNAAAGRMPAYVDTGLCIVHVDDVADGHFRAYQHGAVGERYILGGDNLTFAEILAEIARITGRPAPRLKLPPAFVLPVAWVAEFMARFGRREPFVTVDGIRLARRKMFFTSAKAERALGYRHRPARQGLEDAVAWFRANGYLT